MVAVGTSAPGDPSTGCHHGAHGRVTTDGSTQGTPPSAAEWAASQPQAASTIGSAKAAPPSVSSRMRNATSTGSGWLAAPRRSGSRAFPNPPSGLA